MFCLLLVDLAFDILDTESQLFRDLMLATKELRNGRLITIMLLNPGINAI